MITHEDICAVFEDQFNRHLGTAGRHAERRALVRMLARRLDDHFEAMGGRPEAKEELVKYAREAIERHG